MTEREGRWQSDLEEALTEAENRLLKLDVPRPLSKAAGATLSRARRGERDLALELVAKMRSELAALDELMKDLYEKCIAAERAEAADHPFGEAWLSRLRRTLSKIDPAEDWTARWMDAWSSAVAARKWHTADTVAAMAKKRSGVLVPVKTLIAVDSELAEERWENGIRLIDKLLENGPVPAVAAVRLLVGKARLCLYRLGNPDAAIVATEAAAEWAATGPQWSRDLVRAVRAETLVELGNLGEASHLVAGVLDESVGVPDLLVVAGDLCEREGDLPGAQDLYDAAVLRFGDRATAGLLYAPQSTRLLWRGAVNAWPSDPERVLSLLARGLTLAEASPAEGPERQPWLYRAQILEQLGHRSQAAAAYHTAARRYDHAGLPALDLYERAHALSPEERRYGWSYAEALRIAATADRATPDTGVLEQARAVLDGALEGAVLDPEHAWVLVTSAMIAWQLGEEDALLLAERSLVLDPSYARGYGFVSLLLRLRGFVEPALAAAEGGYRVDRTDPFVTSQLAYARAEAGDIEGALEVLDAYLSYVDGNVHVVVAKASVELWADRAGAALATLELAQDWGSLRGAMLLAQCYAILEMRDRETEIYRELLAPDAARTVGLAGWATYGLGQYDEAIELLTATDPRSETPLVRMDLGQVLLARGRPQDVESGQVLLLDAVADCTNVAQLLQLFHPDLRLLEGRIPHGQESAVANAVSQVREAVVQRIERLRTSRLEPGTIAHTLAQARTDVGADRQGRALKLYLALAGHPDLPEVRIRMQSLGRDLLDQGDVLLQVSGVAAARSPWRAADRLPRHLDELDGLLRQVDARLALADLADPAAEREPGPDSLERLARCRGEDLVHVAPTFARDLTSLRKLLGGLASATRSGRMPWAGQLTDVQRAVYGALLDPGHAQAVNRPGARHIGAVEITLDGGLAREYEDGRLSEHIASLRDELSTETGIQIPGVKVVLQRNTENADALFTVYGSLVGEHRGGVPDAGSLGRMMEAFDQVLRHNLFRWLTVDDLYLWCTGWQPGPGSVDDDLLRLLPTTPWGKLQLTRLVKMLLREGVPARDRHTILTSFSASQSDGGADPRDVFEELRVRLDHVGADDEIVTLPPGLEQRVADAMAKHGRVWSLSRHQACQLLDDLKDLIGVDRSGPVVVTVANPALRSYVWRLLAAERPRVRVMVEGEGS